MTLQPVALNWSLRCYRVLLSLYPVEFRVRFRKEMCQVFRDCCLDEAAKRTRSSFAALWAQTLMDLAVSISRERGRALLATRDLNLRARGLIDSLVILTIIGFHLLAAGTGIALYFLHSYETVSGFLVMATAMGALLGGLGVICSLVLARFRRIHYRLIDL
jgi:hypothetical protein